MYMIPEMIDLGLEEGQEWTSPVHRVVAQNSCLCNPNIFTRDALAHNCQIINKIPKNKIKRTTFDGLRKPGCGGLGA